MRRKILKLLRDTEKQRTFKDKNMSSVVGPYDPEDCSWSDYVEYQQKKDKENLLYYDYEEVLEDEECHLIRLHLIFPNYQFIINEFNSKYEKHIKNPPFFFDKIIKAELKRMETDKLIMIDTQEAWNYVLKENGDFSKIIIGDSWKIKTESIILTTKGKYYWKFIWKIFLENPISIVVSIITIIISLFVYFKK